MNVNGITSTTDAYAAQNAKATKKADSTSSSASKNTTTQATSSEKVTSEKVTSEAAVYESSTDQTKTAPAKTSNADLIAQLKADADQKTSQFRSLVEKMMLQQGKAAGESGDMWKFLAGGEFTVDAQTKAQAQADISEDGYWGVNQTSDRILDFAKALASDDPEKADKMMEAFKEGYKKAEEMWGGKLPEISQKTYDAVLSKFEAWKNEAATTI